MKGVQRELITLTAPADLSAVSLINPMVAVVCNSCRMSEESRMKVGVAVEEVFTYCAGLIGKREEALRVTLFFYRDQDSLHVILEHAGPRGELEDHLLPGACSAIKRSSFEAMGLYIARESLDRLEYFPAAGGKHRFVLSKRLTGDD